MRLRPYPKYKPSGVEWLGDVPEHWGALPLKRRHRIVNGGTPSSAEDSYWDGDINWLTPEDLGRNGGKRIGSSRRALSLEGLSNCSAQLVPRNSIVISTRAPIGHVAVIEKESCTNQGCRTLVPEGVRAYAGYIYYTLLASRQTLQAAGKGTTFLELSVELLSLHAVPFPPSEEQIAIAAFLDRETAKIDTLVAKKLTLIERLKEKRTALISRTVTRGLPPEAARQVGLDPHPKLKPSGVDWLGMVPEHWAVKSIKWVSAVLRGASPRPIDNEIYFDEEGEYAWVRIADVSAAGMYLRETAQQLSDLGRSLSVPLEPGALFLSIAGSVGKPCIAGIKCCIHDGFVYFPFWRGESRFLYYLFASGEPYKGLGKLGTQLNLNTDTVGSIIAGFPARTEQQAIADFLDHETSKLDALVAKIQTAIDRLQEYRTALITAAVTGKIDVQSIAT